MVKAKKHFGQHFLKDDYFVKQIVQSMSDDELDIIEIGPGLGDLTKELLKKKPVTAYEIDSEAYAYLNNVFANNVLSGELSLIFADVNIFWSENKTLSKNLPYKIVANLPYNVGTQIILNGFRDPLCRELLVMVQKEVALKFTASVGDREFCALSVLTESIAEKEFLFSVGPEAFNPPPKVESAVMRIKKNSDCIDEEFAIFLRAAFCQPRKKLFKNLSSILSNDLISYMIEATSLNEMIRPHQVSTELFLELFQIYKENIDDRTRRDKNRD